MGGSAAEPTLWPELRYPDAAAAKTYLERVAGLHDDAGVPRGEGDAAPLMHVEQRLGIECRDVRRRLADMRRTGPTSTSSCICR